MGNKSQIPVEIKRVILRYLDRESKKGSVSSDTAELFRAFRDLQCVNTRIIRFISVIILLSKSNPEMAKGLNDLNKALFSLKNMRQFSYQISDQLRKLNPTQYEGDAIREYMNLVEEEMYSYEEKYLSADMLPPSVLSYLELMESTLDDDMNEYFKNTPVVRKDEDYEGYVAHIEDVVEKNTDTGLVKELQNSMELFIEALKEDKMCEQLCLNTKIFKSRYKSYKNAYIIMCGIRVSGDIRIRFLLPIKSTFTVVVYPGKAKIYRDLKEAEEIRNQYLKAHKNSVAEIIKLC